LRGLERGGYLSQREATYAQHNHPLHPLKGERYQLVQADIRTFEPTREHLHQAPHFEAIITDAPYGCEYLELYSELSKFAAGYLVAGAACTVMTRQAHLGEIKRRLSEHLAYLWTCAYLTPGSSAPVFGRRARSNWKPVIILINGKTDLGRYHDILRDDGDDKRHHRWGQSVSGMTQIIKRFTVAGMLVCDPLCGASTTGVAALATGRLYLGIDCDPAAIQQSVRRLQAISDGA
jgi:hypothetical protein